MSLTEAVAATKITAAAYNTNLKHWFGTGADGALSVPSGTTNIDLGSAQVVVKHYTSINVALGATLGFINPHANGTVIILKSQGDVTIAGTIDASGMGGLGGVNEGDAGADGTGWLYNTDGGTGSSGTGNGSGGAASSAYTVQHIQSPVGGVLRFMCGAGGGAGRNRGTGGSGFGTGGSGGAALAVFCGGAYNFTGTVKVSGVNGANAGANGSGGGGGGAGGSYWAFYNSLTSSAGTVTKTGGNGGTGGEGTTTYASGGGGAGGGGYYTGGAGGTGRDSSSNQDGASGGAGGGTGGGTGGAGGGHQVNCSGGGGGGGGSAGFTYTGSFWDLFF